MLRIKSYKLIFTAVMLFVSGFIYSQENNNPAFLKYFKTFITDPALENASVSFVVYNLNDKKVEFDYNSKQSLVPASVMKIFTTAVALEVYGPEYKFKTTLEYSGNIDTNGVLNGNLYVRGGGDPALGSENFKQYYNNPYFISEWIDSLVSLGIKEINGNVIGDISLYGHPDIPNSWMWGDIGNYYGVGVNALTFNDNLYKVYLRSGRREGDKTVITGTYPKIPNLEIENFVTSSKVNADRAYIYGDPDCSKRTIRGTIPINRNKFTIKGSVPDPAMLLISVLRDELLKKGIKHSGGVDISDFEKKTEARNIICETESPALSKIIKKTNKYSINLYAEHLLKHTALKYDKHRNQEAVSENMKSYLDSIGIDTKGMFLADGSGLSRENAVNAFQLVSILNYMHDSSKYYTCFYNSLPVAGKDGALKNMFVNSKLENNLRAKSGYMKRVRSYSGYFTTEDGKDFSVAIICNNYTFTAYQMKKKIEKLLISLCKNQ